MTSNINLGDKVRDLVTGYEGIASARIEWLNGCVRYEVQSQNFTPSGKLIKGRMFDEQQLALVEQNVVTVPRFETATGQQTSNISHGARHSGANAGQQTANR